jgi:hypothetical protein
MAEIQPQQIANFFTKAHVEKCRELWNSPEFPQAFTSFCQSCVFTNVENRLMLDEIGGVDLVLDVLRDGKRMHPHMIIRSWTILQNFVLVNRVDEPLEMKPIEIFVEKGGVELATIELSRNEPRWGQTILTTLAWTSTNENVVPRVIASGVHKVGIRYVREAHPNFMDISMSFIRSASAAKSCRAALRADGALEAFLAYVECSKSEDQIMMR